MPGRSLTTPVGHRPMLSYTNKAQGPDEISPRLLKEFHTEIAPILTIIFQRSLVTGIVPNDWKHAIITPALKRVKVKAK